MGRGGKANKKKATGSEAEAPVVTSVAATAAAGGHGDDDIDAQQFDYDEDAYVEQQAPGSDGEEGQGDEDDNAAGEEVDEAKAAAAAAKLAKKKQKFAELKERRKRQRQEQDSEDEPASKKHDAKEGKGKSAEEQYLTLSTAIVDTPFRERALELSPASFLVSNPSKKHKEVPFFAAIQKAIPDFQNVKKHALQEPGSPLALIISISAGRCIDLIKKEAKHLRCKVAKLFAKHFKVEEQVEILREKHAVAVGTPNRLKKLVDIGALSLASTKLIIVDMAPDEKTFSLLNSPNVKGDFFMFLCENVLPMKDQLQFILI